MARYSAENCEFKMVIFIKMDLKVMKLEQGELMSEGARNSFNSCCFDSDLDNTAPSKQSELQLSSSWWWFHSFFMLDSNIQGVPKQADIFTSLIWDFLMIINYHNKFYFGEEYITFDILVDLMTFFQRGILKFKI